MKIHLLPVLLVWTTTSTLFPAEKIIPLDPPPEIAFREIHYAATVAEAAARFQVDLALEISGKGEARADLFTGDIALLPPKLPDGLRIERDGNTYRLVAPRPGKYQLKLDVVAKITRAEPWNHVSFQGPPAAIASVSAQANGADLDLQLLSGTVLESSQSNGVSRVRGYLGAETQITLRWQSRAAEVTRQAVVAAESTIAAQLTPTVIKYSSQFRYDVIQGKLPRLTVTLPASHALTRLVGEQIRDWTLAPTTNEQQLLTVEFIKAIEKEYQLTVLSEQTVAPTPTTVALTPPQPLDAEREAGQLTITTEDVQAELEATTGLRQINAPAGALAAYRFSARPLALKLRLKRMEPVVTASDRATIRLEESRLLVHHALQLNVDKAGIYQLELQPQSGFVVAEVRGEGVDDWKMAAGKLRVSFANRILGSRRLEVQLEQALPAVPERFSLAPLRVLGATKETAQVGAAAAAGLQLKTAELMGLREIPVNRLPARADELLAFTADAADWNLTLHAERLAARVIAEIFNLVTIGDGLVGGSATIRYGLFNQGVQEFRVQVPAHWKNVEFTGAHIRRKEHNGDTWTIGLQDKAWGAYTLVVTYDYPFDPHGATLPVAGIRALDVERETGSIAVTTAASLKLTPPPVAAPLRRVDEAELAMADRALITRSVLLAFQYPAQPYDLAVAVKRYESSPVLAAVADRTQLTSVLTEAGELLTQASFMVKNNDKQFQRFLLPGGADFWSCYVNGQAAKPERDGDWLLVPLPRGINRNQAIAVDIVYAEKKAALSGRAQGLQLHAPQTDVPNTYAEWQLYAPTSQRLSRFGGSMNVAQGTDYEVGDAWKQFLSFYGKVLREIGPGLILFGLLIVLVLALVVIAARRGASGLITALVVLTILAILGGMLLPALGKAKAKAQRISSVNNLKQVGLAARIFAGDNDERLPQSFEEMMNELNTDKITYDPETGQRYTYLGAGFRADEITPDSVLAYSPISNGRVNVLFADGSVQIVTERQFAEYAQRGFIVRMPTEELARREQERVVRSRQTVMSGATPEPTVAPEALRQPQSAAPQPTRLGQQGGPTASGGGGGRAGAPMLGNWGGEVSSISTATVATPAPVAQPKLAGLRSIRIDIPRSGQAFRFTKVLNVRDEPLHLSAQVMSLQSFQRRQMLAQVSAFLLGLGVWFWQWRGRRNSFVLTLALALMLGSVSSLLIAWRALHDALIVGLPIALLALLSWASWKFWGRRRPAPTPDESESTTTLPPALASLVLAGLVTGGVSAQATESLPRVGRTQVSVLSAQYTGTVNERVAQLDAVLKLSAAKPGQTVPLFGADVAVQSFSAKPTDARLTRSGGGVAVLLPRTGETTLQLKLLVRLTGDVAKRQLTFGIPGALTSQLALTLDQPDADVEFPGAISFERTTEAQQTRVTAVMGAGDRVALAWTPRVKRAAEMATTVMCQNQALVSLGGGVLSVRATLDYQIAQGELRQARVKLPLHQRLLRVEGEAIRTWSTKTEGNAQVLLVELLKGMSPNYRLTVETERALEALPAEPTVEIPQALDVKRETGMVALRAEDELEYVVTQSVDLQRVDAAAFPAPHGGPVTSAFRFLHPGFGLTLRVAALQPQVEVTLRQTLRVAEEQLTLAVTADYVIKRAGVFALKFMVPSGYRVESLQGNQVLQWSFVRATGLVEVTFKERMLGNTSLRLELVKADGALPAELGLSGVQPVGVQKLTGFVAVTAEAGLALKTVRFTALTEIPVGLLPDASTLGRESGLLAFKLIAAESGVAAPWELSVATERVAPWVRAEVASLVSVSDTLVNGRTLVRLDIQNAPVKEVRLQIPTAWKNVEITGANIRRRDQAGAAWRVELQNKVRGTYLLTVTWDQPRSGNSNRLDLAGLSVVGVERETGTLAVAAKAPLQVAEITAPDLLKLDTHEWPQWAGAADASTALAYRYLRPGYQLIVEARRYSEAEVLQALAETVLLSTVVAEDGQMMTALAVAVRNNGRQHLEITLPAGASVWSAFVAGQAVRPSLRDGKLLLPLENAGSEDAPVPVELTYVSTNQNQFPRHQGRVQLQSPTLDVPLKNARWELYLPPDYHYEEFGGSMGREAGVTFAAIADLPAVEEASFSVLDYSKRESEAKAEAAKGVKAELYNVQKKLAEGNVKDAANYFSRAQNRSDLAASDRDTLVVEQQLRRAQASNIVQAQQDFFFRNNGALNGPAEADQSQAGLLNAAAEQQWEKLQQAQEVAVAKVRPLRVNLPTRGQRHAFTQVLQTAVAKPLTVEFRAQNTRTVNWPGRILGGAAVFLGLWLVVALVVQRRNDAERTI